MTSGRRITTTEWVVLIGSVLFTLILFVIFAQRVPIEDTGLAFDWKLIWGAIEGGQVRWTGRIFTPPWSLPFLLPLGLLTLRASWGVIIFLTLASLFLSIPFDAQKRRRWLGLALLVTSYPALRNYADANVEAFLIFGVLLLLFSAHKRRPYLLGVSVLLAAIKPQATFLLFVILVMTLFQQESPRFYLKTAAVVLLVAIPMLIWAYQPWISSIRTELPPGISLAGMLSRLHTPLWITVPLQLAAAALTLAVAYLNRQRLSRLQVGMLIAGSMVASPYTNALTLLSVLALGVIPLLMKKPMLGLFMFILYDLQFLVLIDPVAYDEWGQLYSGFLLLVTWIVLLIQVYVLEVQPSAQQRALATASQG